MISKTGLHAIKALTLLAALPEGSYAGAATIAGEIGAPPNYLAKLLQTLARSGVVASQKGVRGGFRLARDPSAVRLYDVIDPIDQVGRWNGCFLGRADCSDVDPCPVHDRFAELRDRYLALLSEMTLAHLLAHGAGRGWLHPPSSDAAAENV